jgi:Dolichyl-phosphate-mannose-protein mannosyltransferase
MSKRKQTNLSNPTVATTVAATLENSTEPKKNFGDYIYYAIGLIFVTIIIMARLNLAELPFERDEGSYSYMGQLLTEGKLPYQYFYETKFPGIFYCYAAIVAIFGKTVGGMHLGFMVVNLLSTALVFLIGRLLFDTRAAVATAVAFIVLSLCKNASGFAAQSEHLVVFWAMLGLYSTLCAIKSGKWLEYIFAGFFLGMALLIKQSGVFFALAAGLFMVFHYLKPLNVKAIFTNGLLMIGGFLLALGLFMGIIAAQGGWNEMMYWIFTHSKLYVSGIPFDFGMQLLNGTIKNLNKDYMAYWVMAGLGVVTVWLTSLDFYKKIGIGILLLLAFGSTAPGMRFYGHYFIQFMPALAILVGAFVYSLGDILTRRMSISVGGGIAFGLFALLAFLNVNQQKEYYFSPNYFKIMREVYGDNPFTELKVVADKIKTLAKPGDQLITLGAEPQMYFYTQLHCPTRHSFLSYTSSEHDKAIAWRQEAIQDIENAKPAFLVVVNHEFSWSFPEGSKQELYRFGMEYANKNYDFIGIADLVPNAKPIYVWEQAAQTYKPQGKKFILVFKRKQTLQ